MGSGVQISAAGRLKAPPRPPHSRPRPRPHLLRVVLLVHGPEGVDGAARRQHDALRAARVVLHKLGDVIHIALRGIVIYNLWGGGKGWHRVRTGAAAVCVQGKGR